MKKYDDAIFRFNKAIEIDPGMHEAYNMKGKTLLEKQIN